MQGDVVAAEVHQHRVIFMLHQIHTPSPSPDFRPLLWWSSLHGRALTAMNLELRS